MTLMEAVAKRINAAQDIEDELYFFQATKKRRIEKRKCGTLVLNLDENDIVIHKRKCGKPREYYHPNTDAYLPIGIPCDYCRRLLRNPEAFVGEKALCPEYFDMKGFFATLPPQ